MKGKITTRAAAAGFTLIEVMVAMAITGLVMAVLIEVFSAQQQMYYRQTSLTKAQANARASLAIVSREIRMAGYTGIPLGISHINSSSVGSGPNSIYAVMSLVDNGSSFTSALTPLALTSKIIADDLKTLATSPAPGGSNPPDAFEIFGNFGRGTTGLNTSVASGAVITQIKIPASGHRLFPTSGYNRPAYVVVGNNDRAEIFEFVSSPAMGAGSTTGEVVLTVSGGTVKGDFKSNTEVGGAANLVLPLYRRAYFVDADEIGTDGQTTGMLFVANYAADGTMSGDRVELARDVQEFQVSYDVRNASNWTVTENWTADPCLVNNVRLTINNKGWAPADGNAAQRLDRELTSVVRIRNAGLGQGSCPAITTASP